MDRRDFLKNAGVVVAGLGAAPAVVKSKTPVGSKEWYKSLSSDYTFDSSPTFRYSRVSMNTLSFEIDSEYEMLCLDIETPIPCVAVVAEWSHLADFKHRVVRSVCPVLFPLQPLRGPQTGQRFWRRWAVPLIDTYLRLRYYSNVPTEGKMRAYCVDGDPAGHYDLMGKFDHYSNSNTMIDGVFYDEEPKRLANTVDGTGDDRELDEKKLIRSCWMMCFRI